MPTYQYRLASGKLKRRICGLEFHRMLTEEILRSGAVKHARSRGRLRLVIERPTPIPDIDGWQSAALSGMHTASATSNLNVMSMLTQQRHSSS